MRRARRQDEKADPPEQLDRLEPAPRPELTVLSVQRSAGNQAASRLIQRTHPAFNDVNYWKTPLPAVDDIPAQPRPGSPEAVMSRLKSKFSEAVAHLLLFTDADEQDALDREPMTARFLAEGGTNDEAIKFLTDNPRDNAKLQLAYTACIDGKRQGVTDAFLKQGGAPVEAARLQGAHPTAVAPLELAYHEERLGPLRERATRALTALSDLERDRHSMDNPANVAAAPRVTEMRFGIQEGIQKISKTREGSARADLLKQIEAAEAWVTARQATIATIPDAAREVIKDNHALYDEPRQIVRLLFKTDPFDAAAFDVVYKQWLAQVPMKRLTLQTPQQIIDGLAQRLALAWAIAEDAARPYANRLFGASKRGTVDTIINHGITKATWDDLVARLTFEEVIAAVEHAANTTDARLRALVTRLDRSVLTGPNLAAIAIDPPTSATLVHPGRYFRYNADGTIETEVSVLWNEDVYMPANRRHWGEIHIHYTGTVAAKAQVSYVHVKTDRAMPGGTPVVNPDRTTIVNHLYNRGLIDPAWHL